MRPTLVREMLAAGLIRAEKRNRTWCIDESAVEPVLSALALLRAWQSPPQAEVAPLSGSACPCCRRPGFGRSQGQSGWGEFYECPQCHFSIHELNLATPALLAKAIEAHR